MHHAYKQEYSVVNNLFREVTRKRQGLLDGRFSEGKSVAK
jgi:hypothetical protein